jgi:UDP-glucose 4-epimerase
VPYATVPRREGDPPNLVAASDQPRSRLGWNPRFADLRTIVEHAWKFAAKGPAVV